MTRRIIIHGLRRSGTTILWETLRGDPRLRCYDEPFHPRLVAGARDNHKGTWTEFAAALPTLSARPAAIQPRAELDPTLSAGQATWLAALCDSHDRVVIDIVRGWNRVPSLTAACGDALHVHLLRDPANWAAAHLLPSAVPTLRRRVGDLYRRATFFTRRGGYDGYQYQQIIEAALEQDHPVFRGIPAGAQGLRHAPAYIRLLAFWWGANATIAGALAASGQPSVTVTLADFTAAPDRTITTILRAAGWTDVTVPTGRVRPQSDAFGAASPRWGRAALHLGLPDSLFDPARRDADTFAAILRDGVPA